MVHVKTSSDIMSKFGVIPFKPVETVSSIRALKNLFQFKEKVGTDGFVLKMHARTCLILLVGAFFLTCTQYFGEPITCIYKSQNKLLPDGFIDKFCWMEGTYSIASSKPRAIGSNAAYYGVHTDPGTRVSHRYYHWVYFILILQCFAFYAPRSFWLAVENRSLSELIAKVQNHYSQQNNKNAPPVRSVRDAMYRGSSSFRMLVYCETLCLANICAQIWSTNAFLGGRFNSLGRLWFLESQSDPLIELFPRIVKCGFYFYGPSGSLENIDALCFLPLNSVIEKIYLTLWLWFAFLLFATCFALLCRAFAIFVTVRLMILKRLVPLHHRKFTKKLCEDVGHWFIFVLLAKHTNASVTAAVMDDVFESYFTDNGTIRFRTRDTKQEMIKDGDFNGDGTKLLGQIP